MKLVLLTLCVAAVLARQGEPEKVTSNVAPEALDKAAMQASAFMNQYCSVGDSKMSGEGYRSQFAPDLDQCLNRCNRDPDCSSVDFSADKTCNQHKESGEPGEESGWTHYHRRAKSESGCPQGTAQHVMAPSAYSKQFCVYAGMRCPGHDLYKKSQNIADTTGCTDKCAKIKSCASADFKDGKCTPKDYACTPDELVEDSGSTYMHRLEAGVDECVCISGYTRDAEGVCQPAHPCDGISPQEIGGVAVACRNGNILIQRNAPCGTSGRIKFRQSWATFQAGFGDIQNVDIGYWAGLDFMHMLTTSDDYRLILELKVVDGPKYWAYYDNFVVGSEADGYRLSVGTYSGDAGDAFNQPQFNDGTANGSQFSTPDHDNDPHSWFNCAAHHGSGWWFSGCHADLLNGPCPGETAYLLPKKQAAQQWYPTAWDVTTLEGTYMMVRKMQ